MGIGEVSRYPVTVDCPLCSGVSKLELRTPDHVQCRSCHFSGDLVSLYAKKTGVEIADAVGTLQQLGALDLRGAESGPYVDDAKRQDAIKGLIAKRLAWIAKEGFGFAIPSILDRLNCRQYIHGLPALLPHVIPLRREDLIGPVFASSEAVPKECKQTWVWWSNYSALTVPVYHGTDIIGLHVMTSKETRYLPFVGGSKRIHVGAAFGLLPSYLDPAVLVVDDVHVALRYMLWSLADHGRVVPFVAPQGIRDTVEFYQGGRTVFWSPRGDPKHYLRAIETPRAQTLDHTYAGKFDVDRDLPFRGSFGQLIAAAQESVPAHQAAAVQLCRMPEPEARTVLATVRLDAADRAKVLAYVGGDDARHVASLFENAVHDETITWGGDIITDTQDGWISRGRVISSAKFYIEKIRPQGNSGEAIAEGVILYRTPTGNRVSFKFVEQITAMRKDTGEWLQRRVISITGFTPFVDPPWSKKLIEIAQQFHAPVPILGTQYYGWNEDVLRMPNFTVDANGLQGAQALVEGPMLLLPAPLSDAEWDAFTSETFCRVFLAFLGNVIRTKQGRPGFAMLLANEPHVVFRLADAFAAQVVTNPRRDVLEEATLQPLPVFVEFSHKAANDFFLYHQNPANVVVNTDSKTALFAAFRSTWLKLDIQGAINYGALRAIFLALPEIMRAPAIQLDRDDFYRRIVHLLGFIQMFQVHRTELLAAAAHLDTKAMYSSSTLARRVMETIVSAHRAGELEIHRTENYVRVSTLAFMAAVSSPMLPPPDIKAITLALVAARFITSGKHLKQEWEFPVSMWDIHMSMVLS